MKKKTLIMGIGNVLMGDEGIAVKIVNDLQQKFPAEHFAYLDGGTGGFHLLEYFQKFERVVLIDATIDGDPAGTVQFIRPKYSSDYPPTLTAHDIGLKDLLDSLFLLGSTPEIHLITISIEIVNSVSTELSPSLHKVYPEIINKIKVYLQEIE